MNSIFIFILLIFSLSKPSEEVQFRQEGKIMPLVAQDDGTYLVKLKPAPFMLVFPGEEMHICAGLEADLFQHAKSGTDINADFNSYFFIYKFLAGAPDSEFLSVEKDTGMSLNATHGAKPFDQGISYYKISSLQLDRERLPLNSAKQLFVAIWLDQNKDQFIDPPELMHVNVMLE